MTPGKWYWPLDTVNGRIGYFFFCLVLGCDNVGWSDTDQMTESVCDGVSAGTPVQPPRRPEPAGSQEQCWLIGSTLTICTMADWINEAFEFEIRDIYTYLMIKYKN